MSYTPSNMVLIEILQLRTNSMIIDQHLLDLTYNEIINQSHYF